MRTTKPTALIVIGLLASLSSHPALAQSSGEKAAGLVTSLIGEGALSRGVPRQSQALRAKEPVFSQDKISTAEKSLARVLLGGKAVITIRELSSVTIAEDAARSVVELGRGRLALALGPGRVKPGEAVEVRTANAVGVVRGTVLIVDIEGALNAVGEPDPANMSATFAVLEGTIEVTCRTADCPPATVLANQGVTVKGKEMGTVHPVPKGKAAEFLASLGIDVPEAERMLSQSEAEAK